MSGAINVLKKRNKIILSLFILVLLMMGSVSGAVYYYYSHPSSLKSIIEARISQSTGTTFTINSLSYSLDPLKIQIRGILFEPKGDYSGFHLEIPDLKAEMSLEGRFGHKALVFKALHVNRFSFRISDKMRLPALRQDREDASFLSRIIKWVAGIFLFRDIRFQSVEIIDGGIFASLGNGAVLVERIMVSLDHDQLLDISCSTKARWPLDKISLNFPDLRITTDRKISFVDPNVACQLTAGGATFQFPDGELRNTELTANLSYEHKTKSLAFDPVKLCFEDIDLKEETKRDPVKLNGCLKAEGSFKLADTRLDATSLFFTLNDMVKLGGALTATFGARTGIKLNDLEGYIIPEKVLALLPIAVKEKLPPLFLSGPVSFSGNVGGHIDDQRWRWNCDLQAGLKENQLSYVSDQVSLVGILTGTVKAEGEFPDILIHSAIEGNKTLVSGKAFEVGPLAFRTDLIGRYPFFALKNLVVDIPRVKTEIGEKEILLQDIRVEIPKGRLDGKNMAILLPEINIGSPLLSNIRLSLIINDKEMNIKLHGKHTGLIRSAHALNLLPFGWQLSGLDSIRIDASLKEKRDLSFAMRLGLKGLGFEDRDSVFMGENISLYADIRGKADLQHALVSTKAEIKADMGEILYDRFYVDLKSNAFILSCEGDYKIPGRLLKLSDFSFGLADIGSLNVNGTIINKADNREVCLYLDITEVPIKPPFQHFLVEPFGTDAPLLSGLKVGGTISAHMKLTSDNRSWVVKGPLSWLEGNLELSEEGPSFEGIHLELPVWYESRQGHPKGGDLHGKLSVQAINLPFLPEQSVVLGLDAGPNSLSIRAPTVLQVPGGEVRIGPVKGSNLFGSRPSIETSLIIDSIDLNPLMSELWSKETGGRIYGKLDPIIYETNDLKSHGQIKAEVFGGKIIISDINMSGMFTSAPVLKANAVWRDIALAELTFGTSFGRIEGILEGYAKNLEIAYGEPQSFDLLLETVKKRGVTQKISVKAVDNIAIIGGGQSPFVGLAGRFAALFKEFPYDKIGVHAYLENDAFAINGTTVEGGREYLVKRGGFSGINVVNQNPGVSISFKDMIKRIKRVTAGTGSPVVK